MSDEGTQFLEDLMTLFGEVPTPVIVKKIGALIGDDAESQANVLDHVRFWSQSLGQLIQAYDADPDQAPSDQAPSEVPLDRAKLRAMDDVIATLSG